MKPQLIIATLLFTATLSCQGVKTKDENQKTKMESFSSATGVITKFTDFNLKNLKASYTVAETRIRKLSGGGNVNYFYQIEKTGKYSNSTCSIEYSDLLELIKALEKLESDTDNDALSSADYLENKFITPDGFELGYYIKEKKAKWYVKLEKYGKDTTLFIKEVSDIETALISAKEKIEQLKKQP